MSCTDCWNKKGQDESLSVLRKQAKAQATEKNCYIAIVDDTDQYVLCEASVAVQNNYKIKEVVAP